MRRMLFINSGRQIDFSAVFALYGLCAGGKLCHGSTKRPEVVYHGLINKNIAVGKEQYAFLAPGFPQPPDNLKGGIGLAGAGGHDQQDAILSLCNGLYGVVNGNTLVVARLFAACIFKVILNKYFS